ncbi:MAG: RHS repeat-associated core domain-containing protein [Halanaerobiales bacterium]
MTDGVGKIVMEQDYMPFGEDLPVVGQTEIMDEEAGGYKYTGQKEVVSIGLYYYGARYYDPSLGRFITEDSYPGEMENPQTQNLYVYVMNNPLRYIDPTGHSA